LIPADSLRAVLDSVFRAPAYDWSRAPRGPQLIERWWARLSGWLFRFQHGHPGLFRALIIAVAAMLGLILLHGIATVVLTARRASRRDDAEPSPASPRYTATQYFQEADRLAAEGRFGEAMYAAFLGLILQLDQRGLLRFHPSKTPADYTREAQLAPRDRAALTGLVRRLYAVVFGGAQCTADDYQQWRSASGGEWHAAR
jgi:uncharacterized protein DUF4129